VVPLCVCSLFPRVVICGQEISNLGTETAVYLRYFTTDVASLSTRHRRVVATTTVYCLNDAWSMWQHCCPNLSRCSRSYKNKKSLSFYLTCKYSQSPEYQCGICGKQFRQKWNLTKQAPGTRPTVNRCRFKPGMDRPKMYRLLSA